jgi:hypothetical protein
MRINILASQKQRVSSATEFVERVSKGYLRLGNFQTEDGLLIRICMQEGHVYLSDVTEWILQAEFKA